MPITNPSSVVTPVVQEVKPVVAPEVKPVVQEVKAVVAPVVQEVKAVVAPEVKLSAPLKSARPSGKSGNPIAPTPAHRTVNAVPQTKLPSPPQDSYLCNAIR